MIVGTIAAFAIFAEIVMMVERFRFQGDKVELPVFYAPSILSKAMPFF
jgi:hypothetical protein